jgi:hypothetical protein
MMGLPSHVDATEDLDGDAASAPTIVGVRQLTSSSQLSRPATDDAPAATLRAGLNVRARSLSAVRNAQPVPVTPPLRSRRQEPSVMPEPPACTPSPGARRR